MLRSPASLTPELAARGSASLSGEAGLRARVPTVGPPRIILAGAGLYLLTGHDALITRTRHILAESGSYILTGYPAELSTTAPALLTAEPGAYALTGNAAALVARRLLSAASGAYAVTGHDAVLARRYTLAASAGSYAVTGHAAALLAKRLLNATSGTYVLTGHAAELTHSGVGVAFGDRTFVDIGSDTNTWTASHTFAAGDNLCMVAVSREDSTATTISSVVLDPSGANIPLSLIAAASEGSVVVQQAAFYGVYNFTPQTGNKNVVVSLGANRAGVLGVWTFSNAGRLPTTGDFSTADVTDTSCGPLNIAIGAGEESGFILGVSNVDGTPTITPSGISSVHEGTGAGGQKGNLYEDAGPLTNPETPSFGISASRRAAFVGVKIVGA